ncbi:MAG: hypothetical protein KKB31_02005 [Nanoarchaeota archaeon]|nr:hypothetical protein [Nanoarchaeota archaeon]
MVKDTISYMEGMVGRRLVDGFAIASETNPEREDAVERRLYQTPADLEGVANLAGISILPMGRRVRKR